MNIEEQRKVADEVLDLLECIDIHAILAGGAPRDWHFGREATDLDFYFYSDHSVVSVFGMVAKLRKLGLPCWIKGGYTYDNKNPHLLFVFDGMYQDMKVQLMWMNIPASQVVDTFALDICQVWYKDGEIHLSPNFDLAVQTKSIHILNPLFGKQDKYIQKIARKFPDFVLVDTPCSTCNG